MAMPSDNLFIGDLPVGLQQEQIEEIFGQYGSIQSCKVMDNGAKCACLVRFSSTEEAQSVMGLLDGFIPQGLEGPVTCRFANNPKGAGKGKEAGVGYSPMGAVANGGDWGDKGWGKGGAAASGAMAAASPTGVTMDQVCDALEASGSLPGEKHEDGILFVGNLPPDTSNEHLYRMFAPFGPVGSVKTMQQPGSFGACKGFGFVNFSVPQSAAVAIQTMNGMVMPDGRPLSVKIKTPTGNFPAQHSGGHAQDPYAAQGQYAQAGPSPGVNFGGTQANRKTALCMYHQRGFCQRGEACSFAHGPEDLNNYAGGKGA